MNSRPPNEGPPPSAPNPREELEARLTALALGEAGEFEAETLRARVAADPELAALYRRLEAAARAFKNTFDDEQAAALPPLPEIPEQLSPARRANIEKLFAESRTSSTPQIAVLLSTKSSETPVHPPVRFLRNRAFWQILAAAACVVFVAYALLMPKVGNVIKTASSSQTLSAPNAVAANQPAPSVSNAKNQLTEKENINEPAPQLIASNNSSPGNSLSTMSAAELANSMANNSPKKAQPLSVTDASKENFGLGPLDIGATEPPVAANTPPNSMSNSMLTPDAFREVNPPAQPAPVSIADSVGTWGQPIAADSAATSESLAAAAPSSLADTSAYLPPPPPPPPPPPVAPATRRGGAGGLAGGARGGFGGGGGGSARLGGAGGARRGGAGGGTGGGGRRGGGGGGGGGGGFGGGAGGAAAVATAPAAPGSAASEPLAGSAFQDGAVPAAAPALVLGNGTTNGNLSTTIAGGGSLVVNGALLVGSGNLTLEGSGNLARSSNFGGDAGSGSKDLAVAGSVGLAPGDNSRAANSIDSLNSFGGVTTINGGGILTQTALSANTSGGNFNMPPGVAISSGAVVLGNFSAGSGALDWGSYNGVSSAGAGGLFVNNNNDLTGRALVSQTGGNVTLAGGDLLFGRGSIMDVYVSTYAGTLSGNGSLVKAGAGMLSLSDENTFNGSTLITSGTFGSSGLSKKGSGMLSLMGANTYAGDTTVSAGSLVLGNALALQNSTLSLAGTDTYTGGTVITGGTLQLRSGITDPAAVTLPVGATGIWTVAGGSLTISANNSNPNVIVSAGSLTNASGGTGQLPSAKASPRSIASPTAKAISGTGTASIIQATPLLADASQGMQSQSPSGPAIMAGKAPVPPANDQPVARPPSAVQFPPPMMTADNAYSTFALNVSDTAYQLARAALRNHRWPDPAATRTEEFLNAFQYHDPAPGPGEACGLNYDLGQNPVEAGGNLLRVSFQTSATGRDRSTPLRLTILLDGSGSMTRADRVATVQAAVRALGALLRPGDTVSLVTFARTATVRANAVPAEQFSQIVDIIDRLLPDGGTNMEDALQTAYATARANFDLSAQNRVILLTDGAANLGELEPAGLAAIVEQNRKAGIALDAYGVGWDGYDDTVLEALTRKSDGRYAFLNGPQDVDAAFATKLAGALSPAAQDVKLQIEFNPQRVVSYRLMGYNNLRMTQQQFRDNSVSAGELAAAEQGTALYNLVINTQGAGPIGTVRVRYRDPGTTNYHELTWTIRYNGLPPAFDLAPPALRLATAAAYFAEYLQRSPFAAATTPRQLLEYLRGVPEAFAPDPRPASLVEAISDTASLAGN